MNEPLRRALDAAGLNETDLAAKTGVDPKTVSRWISGRIPYARHRRVVATLLNAEEKELWPIAHRPTNRRPEPASEVLNTYPHRWAVPRSTWLAFFQQAETQIDILAYAALFLAEDAGIVRTIADRANNGVAVRLLLGDPDGSCIQQRGEEEGIGASITAKIHNVLALLRPLLDLDGVELRFHDTVLYNSIYRSDDELLINPHVYGLPAAQAPTLHLHTHQAGTMAHMYLDSFEGIWTSARYASDLH
jgi:transcriptional regulator with XRE-family HTH domain